MNKLTDLMRGTTGAGPEWQHFPADAYLDHRYRNWIISEEMGDVRFVPEAGVVLVHRVRAEHIRRALGAATRPEGVLAQPTRMAPELVRLPGPAREAQPLAVSTHAASRWRDIWGWLGIVAGAAVLVVALVAPLDDPALVVALVIGVRGGCLIVDDPRR